MRVLIRVSPWLGSPAAAFLCVLMSGRIHLVSEVEEMRDDGAVLRGAEARRCDGLRLKGGKGTDGGVGRGGKGMWRKATRCEQTTAL